jgi:hypothetical protein
MPAVGEEESSRIQYGKLNDATVRKDASNDGSPALLAILTTWSSVTDVVDDTSNGRENQIFLVGKISEWMTH